MSHNNLITIETWKATLICICYLFVSWTLFAMASAYTWIGLLFVMPLYTLYFFIIGLIVLIKFFLTKDDVWHFSKKRLRNLFHVQIIAVTFSLGDGADAYGTTLFIQRILNIHELPYLSAGTNETVVFSIGLLTMAVYIIALAVAVFFRPPLIRQEKGI